MNRPVDIIFVSVALLFLLPLFLLIGFFIIIDSRGGVIYKQQRVGKDNHDFSIFKFRTMVAGADKQGLITTGSTDRRVTRTGQVLRKYKLDELPQLFNILKGEMSLVGPRPEVRKYVDLYNNEEMKVLSVRPGLTDYASLQYINEGEILSQHENPESVYIEEIMPAKLVLNLKYIEEKTWKKNFQIIFKTVGKIISGD